MVDDLASRLAVTAVTVRADLDSLAQEGALLRSHGGAVKRSGDAPDFPISLKETLHRPEKVRIGKAAAKLVEREQTVILDSGTTTAEVARHLKQRNIRLTAITNALNIAMILATAPRISLVMLGGMLRPNSYSMVGPPAEAAVKNLSADHFFLGVDALDPRAGVFTPDLHEAQLNSLMLDVSQHTTLVADSSKFARRSLSLIARVDRIQRLITDAGVAAEDLEALRAAGVEVIVV